MSSDLPSQIHSELAGLDSTKQRQVLAFVRTLKQYPAAVTGKQLKQFSETLSEADAKLMADSIESGCEQVDTDGW